MQLNRTTLPTIKAEILAALQAVATKHGLTFNFNGGTFSPDFTNATLRLEICTVGANGEAQDKYKSAFIQLCSLYDLKPTDLGRQFISQGRTYTIAGLNPNSGKFPIIATRDDGKGFKFPAKAVKLA